MEAKTIIAVGTAYAWIYYLAARRLLFQLKDIDKDYFTHLGARGGIGSSNSSAVIALVFDGDVPKESWPASFKRQLLAVRIMLALSPIVLIAIFMLL